MASKFLIATTVVGLALAGGFVWLSTPKAGAQVSPVASSMHTGTDTLPGLAPEDIIVPQFSALAKRGEVNFNESCSACHGVNVAGTNKGPTLIHSLYRTSHHPDGSIVSAATKGVTSHHWRFGNMPPLAGGITPQRLTSIIAYIREVQRANGIN